MKIDKIYRILGIVGLLLCYILMVASYQHSQSVAFKKQVTQTTANSIKPFIDSVNYFRNIIESDQYLKQHFLAVKYQDSVLTPETAIRFMAECNLNEIDINLGVALKETGLRAGTARIANNLHGLKKANKRFSWATGWTSSRYCSFDNPYFSFLEMNEYLNTGNVIWSSHSIPEKYRNLIDSLTNNKGY